MHHYATRNNALVPAAEWVLNGPTLLRADGKGPPHAYALKGVREVRLEFAPTRPEPNRYRCRLWLSNGQVIDFFNRTYRGMMDFADTSAEYTAFVQALLLVLREHAPACRFVGGASPGNYLLGVAGFVMAALALLVVFVFVLTSGIWWLALLKAAIIAFYLPVAWRWLRRNREREFDPGAPPADLLPSICF